MNNVYLLIGGNLGDREKNLFEAKKHVEKTTGKIVQESLIYQTAAWGIKEQPDFLNQVLLVKTNLKPRDCLDKLLAIENIMGRVRTKKNAARIIDIDILLYNDDVISQPGLTIPHPEIANRRFALAPLNQIAPDLIHPVLKVSISHLLSSCPDTLDVHIFNQSYHADTDEI